MGEIKGLRRTIIVICFILLALSGFSCLPASKYYNKDIKKLVAENKAQVIEVGKGMKIDNDTIYIKRIINTKDRTYIRYSYIRKELGWSFPLNTIKIFDDKGKEYRHQSGTSSGKLWGQDALDEVEKLDKDAKYITLKLDWYDRKNELKISLGKEGEVSENN